MKSRTYILDMIEVRIYDIINNM